VYHISPLAIVSMHSVSYSRLRAALDHRTAQHKSTTTYVGSANTTLLAFWLEPNKFRERNCHLV
jgi:hypothetical protein